MRGPAKEKMREAVKGAATGPSNSNTGRPPRAMPQSGDILKRPLEDNGQAQAQLPLNSASASAAAGVGAGASGSSSTANRPESVATTGTPPAATSATGCAPATQLLKAGSGRGAQGASPSPGAGAGTEGGTPRPSEASELETAGDSGGDEELQEAVERSESWSLPHSGWMARHSASTEQSARGQLPTGAEAGAEAGALNRDSSASWNVGEGQARTHVLGTEGERKNGEQGDGAEAGKEGSTGKGRKAGKGKAGGGGGAGGEVVNLGSAKHKKGSPLGCAFGCCWATGLLFYVLLIAYAIYSMLPQKQILAIQEALLGSEPQPTPGDRLALQGFTAKHPMIFVPGIVTGGLELWQGRPCAQGLFRKRLWGGTFGDVYKRPACWAEHMILDNVTGLDPPGIRVRPVSGLVAADWFIPGYFVWAVLIEELAKLGYDEGSMFMASYDWRLSFLNTEKRDGSLSRMKANIELLVKTNKQKAVIVAHSMGALQCLFFLKWVEADAPLGGGGGPQWVANHIHTVVNLAGPLLGVPKAFSGLFSAEARDVALFRALAPMVVDNLQALQHVMRVSRTWDSTMSLLPKGGEAVWGNASAAPDDTFHCTRRRWVATAATACASDKVSEAVAQGEHLPRSASTSPVPNPLVGQSSAASASSTHSASSGSSAGGSGSSSSCCEGEEGCRMGKRGEDGGGGSGKGGQGGARRVLYANNRPKYGRMVTFSLAAATASDQELATMLAAAERKECAPAEEGLEQAGKTPTAANMSCGEVWTEYQELPGLSLGAIARQLVYTAGTPEGDHWDTDEGGDEGASRGGGTKHEDASGVNTASGRGAETGEGAGAGAETDDGAGAVGAGERQCSAGTSSEKEGGEGSGSREGTYRAKECAAEAQSPTSGHEKSSGEKAADTNEAEVGKRETAGAAGESREAGVHPGRSPKAKLRTGSILDLLRRVAPKMMARADANWGFGMASNLEDPKYHHPKYWSNPLETKLPDAPEMEILCLYGVGILTERAFVYKVSPANDTCVIPFRIDTSADTDASPLHAKGGFTFPQSLFNSTPFNTQFFSDQKQDGSGSDGGAGKRKKGGSDGADGGGEVSPDEEDSGCLHDGVLFGEGDETVPTISAALPCTKIWKGKTRFNPAGIKTVTREYNHVPPTTLLEGRGTQSASHVDIMGNFALIEDILRLAAGQRGKDLGGDRFYSQVPEWSERVQVPL